MSKDKKHIYSVKLDDGRTFALVEPNFLEREEILDFKGAREGLLIRKGYISRIQMERILKEDGQTELIKEEQQEYDELVKELGQLEAEYGVLRSELGYATESNTTSRDFSDEAREEAEAKYKELGTKIGEKQNRLLDLESKKRAVYSKTAESVAEQLTLEKIVCQFIEVDGERLFKARSDDKRREQYFYWSQEADEKEADAMQTLLTYAYFYWIRGCRSLDEKFLEATKQIKGSDADEKTKSAEESKPAEKAEPADD